MSSLNLFRSLPIVPFKPDILARWLSGWKFRLPSEFLNPRSPEFIPAMATALLIAAAGMQLALPLPNNLPPETELAPRRAREPAAPVAPDFAAVLATPIFAPDRKPDASAVPVAGGMNGFIALGIAVAAQNASAVVRGPGGVVQRLKPGDEIQGWKLVTVEFDRLTFERNKERRVLMIQKGTGPLATNGHGPDKNSTTATSLGDNSDNSNNSSDDDNNDDN